MNAKKVRLLVRTCITYGHLGYLNLEDQELICLYDECLNISQYFGDILSVIQLYMLLAEAKEKMHCFEESTKYLNQMLKITERKGYVIMEMLAFLSMALRYTLLYKLHKAIECYQKVINISRNIGVKEIEGRSYGALGDVYNKLGKFHEMKECSEKCIKIAKETRNKELEGIGHLHLGVAYLSLAEWNEAISSSEDSMKIALQLDDKKLLAAAYSSMGIAYQYLGDLDQAQKYLEKSLKIRIEIGDRQGESTSYLNLGVICRILGKFQEAINFYQKSLSIASSLGDKTTQGTLNVVLGGLYGLLSKYHKAIQCFEESLEVFKEIGNKMGEGETYRHLGIVYGNVGKSQESIENFQKSLAFAKETGYKRIEMACYGDLGKSYRNLEQYEEALDYLVKCLDCAIEIGDKIGEGNAYCHIGVVHFNLRNPGKPLKYLEKSLSIATSIGDKHGEGEAYYNLGQVYYGMKKYDEAIRCLEKSVNIAMEIGNKGIAGSAGHTLGLVFYDLSVIFDEEGDGEKCREAKEKSEKNLKEALQCWEWNFTHLKDLNNFKISIVDIFIQTYKILTKVLIEHQKTDEALLISDRGRARSLGDILTAKYGITEERAPTQAPLDSTGLESVLSSNIFCILFFGMPLVDKYLHAWVLTHQKPIVFVNTRSQALTAVKALREIYHKIYEMETRCCENRSFESTEDSQHPNAKRKAQTKESLIHSVERNVDSDGEPQVNVTEENTDQLEVLFSLLFTPVIQHLQQKEIVIIPEGPLYMVPFAALRDPTTGKYLSETKSIRISPSLATLKALRECAVDYHSKTGALIVGDPDVGEVIFKGETKEFDRLPSAKREAECIAAILDVKPLTESQATKEMVKKKLQEGVAVIHIAAHGDSEHGHIALAPPPRTDGASIPEEQDYMLTMEEVQEIGVTAQLVVLSCCHSGRGDIKAEGVVGMSRAFLAAGARAVVASLWAIDDYATSRFMSSFYASLKMGDSASKSLQNAMDDIREEEGYEDPMYWAPFFLIGDDVTITA